MAKAAARTKLNLKGTTIVTPTDKEPAKGAMATVVAAFAGGKEYRDGHAEAHAAFTAQHAEKPIKSAQWSTNPNEYILGYVKGAIKAGYLHAEIVEDEAAEEVSEAAE